MNRTEHLRVIIGDLVLQLSALLVERDELREQLAQARGQYQPQGEPPTDTDEPAMP